MRAGSLLIALLILPLGHVVKACSIRPAPPPVTVEPDFVAFAGVVEGYASPMELLKDRPAASGLKVRVTEGAIAAQAGTIVDVYPLAHGSDCKAVPLDLDKVKGRWRSGTTVSVVGWSEPGGVGFPSIVRTSGQGTGIVPADYPRTANGTLDFAKASKSLSVSGQTDSVDYWQRVADARSFQDYEFYKSLALLTSGLDESHKVAELENIRYYHGYACMAEPGMRRAYIELVNHEQLAPSARESVLAGLPKEVDASGHPPSLKGTVFDGYCNIVE